jgi:hypothetical protein
LLSLFNMPSASCVTRARCPPADPFAERRAATPVLHAPGSVFGERRFFRRVIEIAATAPGGHAVSFRAQSFSFRRDSHDG